MEVVQFVRDFKIARSSTINALYYHHKQVAQRRLKSLVDAGELRQAKTQGENLYYIKPPAQMYHRLLITEFLRKAALNGEKIKNWQATYHCGNVLADALLWWDNVPTFVEVQVSQSPNVLKYEKLRLSDEWRECFVAFPQLAIITDQEIPRTGLDIIRVKASALTVL